MTCARAHGALRLARGPAAAFVFPAGKQLLGRPWTECRARALWSSVLPAQEDEQLTKLIQHYGTRNWSIIAAGIKGRSGKSCRLRCVCSSSALRRHALVYY